MNISKKRVQIYTNFPNKKRCISAFQKHLQISAKDTGSTIFPQSGSTK